MAEVGGAVPGGTAPPITARTYQLEEKSRAVAASHITRRPHVMWCWSRGAVPPAGLWVLAALCGFGQNSRFDFSFSAPPPQGWRRNNFHGDQ